MSKKFLKDSEILHFDVDTIEVYGTLRGYKDLFLDEKGEETINREHGEYSFYKRFKVKGFRYKIEIRKNNVLLFAWYHGEQLNEYIETRDYFYVYGKAFLFMSLSNILDYIEENIDLDYVDRANNKKYHTLKRLDLALDVSRDISNILSHFTELKQKWGEIYGNGGKTETYYIWEPKIRKNKALLIRVYDKIADIFEKEKEEFYADYLKIWNVTRLEIEFRSDLLKEVKLSQFLDRSFGLWLFTLYMEKHTPILKNFKDESIEKLSRLNKKVDLGDLRNRQKVRNRYRNTFYGYAKKFIHLQWCPVDTLIREGIYSETTMNDIILASQDWVFDREEYIHGVTQRNTRYLFADNLDKDDE